MVAGWGGDVADKAREVNGTPYVLQGLLVCGKEVGLDPVRGRNLERVLSRGFYKDRSLSLKIFATFFYNRGGCYLVIGGVKSVNKFCFGDSP